MRWFYGQKIMGEKQSRWHTAMAPHCFSLSKRLGTARPSSPSIGSVLGLMLYTPLHTRTAVFTSLCVSDAFAVAVSYYKKMRCFFFCLFSAFLVPPVSPAPWYLSPLLDAQHVCFLVTTRQDLAGTRYSLLSHLVIPALK